ncbi:MAG TPA: hypothetical protein VLU43_01000 [Anaeromyxobacteraceae bacterium]|nr:hypothetical protein [Anaeromyxobacteraceae bacterium]
MSVRVLEELEVFTPLGIRFWDPVLERSVVDGLVVEATPPRGPRAPATALRTRADVWVFRWLPGMRAVEHVLPDPDFSDASPPRRRPFVVAVSDTLERFLPVAFEVQLPLPYRGVFLAGGADGSPPQPVAGVPLFSAPTRRADERLTAVRGTLQDADSGAPASWALVRVDAPHGRTFHGMADAGGRFAVVFPPPPLVEGFGGSPAGLGDGVPLGERGWDVSVQVQYEPGRLTSLPRADVPEYRSILDQRAGSLWAEPSSAGGSPGDSLALHLDFGEELILRTGGRSVQLVSAAPASP